MFWLNSPICYWHYSEQICAMWLQNGINKHLQMQIELMTACVSQSVINYSFLLAAGTIQTNISALWLFLKASVEFVHNRRTATGKIIRKLRKRFSFFDFSNVCNYQHSLSFTKWLAVYTRPLSCTVITVYRNNILVTGDCTEVGG